MAKRGRKAVDLDSLMFWEQRWWGAFRQLRDGPGFMFDARIWEKEQERRRRLKTLEKMTVQEFFASEVEEVEHPTDTIAVLLGPTRPWLVSLDAAQAEREHRIAGLRRSLKKRQRVERRRAIWRALIAADTPGALRLACRRWARLPDVQEQIQSARVHSRWVRRYGTQRREDSRWCSPEEISLHANEFLAITRGERFPKGKDSSQLDFVARGMAGVFSNASPLTAIRLLRNMSHDAKGPLWDRRSHCCTCWRCEEEEDNRIAWRRARRAQAEKNDPVRTVQKKVRARLAEARRR